MTGLIALTGLLITLFKIWWFHDGRHDLAALILSGSSEPGPIRRLIATGTAWFYIATTALLWMVSSAAAMMSNGGRWAEASAMTQVAIVLIPILAVGVAQHNGIEFRCPGPDGVGEPVGGLRRGVHDQRGGVGVGADQGDR